MVDETQQDDITAQITEHMLPLRDRIIKIETIINYHDKEFQNVKNSLADLTETVDRHQSQILERLEQYNKVSMDITYEQYRENQTKNADIVESITANRNQFDKFVGKWRAVTRAVWLTISLISMAIVWAITTGTGLGIIEVNNPYEQVKPDDWNVQSESNDTDTDVGDTY